MLQPGRGSAAERRVQLQASAQRRRLPPPRPPVPGVGRHQTTRMGGTGQNAAAHAATDRATPRYKHAVSNSERRSSGRRRPREAGPSGPSHRVEPRPATPGIQKMRRATPSATWTSLARPLPRERGGYLYGTTDDDRRALPLSLRAESGHVCSRGRRRTHTHIAFRSRGAWARGIWAADHQMLRAYVRSESRRAGGAHRITRAVFTAWERSPVSAPVHYLPEAPPPRVASRGEHCVSAMGPQSPRRRRTS